MQGKITDFFELKFKKSTKEEAKSPHPNPKNTELKLPHYFKKSWSAIKKLLYGIVFNGSIKSTADYLEILQQIIVANYLVKARHKVNLKGLCSFLHWIQKESEFFLLKEILPFIAMQALNSETLFQHTKISILAENTQSTVHLTREQIASILSVCFFCAMPIQRDTTTPSNPNFYSMFRSDGNVIMNKLLFLVNYFTALKYDRSHHNDIVVFTRLCEDPNKFKSLDWNYWKKSTTKMSAIIVIEKGRLEDEQESYCVDFANKYIGGGAMDFGAVQEEILFQIMPELFFTRLITEKLNDNEALVVEGLGKYSEYVGYSSDLKFAGNHKDAKSKFGRKVIAIDAIPFSSKRDRLTQFHKSIMLRELNKCYIGFKVKGQIATGRWGCGAFNGNSQLKLIIQWLAASQNHLPLSFYTYEDKTLLTTHEIIKALDNLTVGELCNELLKFEEYYFDSLMKDKRVEEIEKDFDNILFEYLLRKMPNRLKSKM